MYSVVPTPILILAFLFVPLALAQTSRGPPLTPPSTFGSATGTASSTSSSSSSTVSGSGSTSANASTSATATSSAQFPSLSGYPTCVTQCLSLAISQAGCTSEVDVNCFCETGLLHFEQGIVNCVSTQCATELSSTENLSQQFCNLANTSVSLSFPAAPPTASSSASSSSASSTAPSSTSGKPSASGNSASGLASQGVGTGLLVSLVASAVAIVFGAFFV